MPLSDSTTHEKQLANTMSTRTYLVVCTLIIFFSLTISWLTRSYCIKVTVYHAAAAVEDGLIWFDVPLERRARLFPSRGCSIRRYVRVSNTTNASFPTIWKAGPRVFYPAKDLMLESNRPHNASVIYFAGFGWFHDQNLNPPAPPEYCDKVRFVGPIWFALTLVAVMTLALTRKRTFRISSLIFATATIAVALWFVVIPAT